MHKPPVRSVNTLFLIWVFPDISSWRAGCTGQSCWRPEPNSARPQGKKSRLEVVRGISEMEKDTLCALQDYFLNTFYIR